MFNRIDVNGLAAGANTNNKVTVLCNRILADTEYISDENYLYIKDGLYYTEINKDEFIREFRTLFIRMCREPGYGGKLYQSKWGNEAWEQVKGAVYERSFDYHPDLVPFANGIYNITTGVFSSTFAEKIVKHFDFDYIESGANPTMFIQAIEEIIPNEDDRRVFLTFINYSFSGDISQQLALILQGSGNNGKTALMEFFVRLMGSRATTAKINKLGDESVRCNLNRRTLCYSSEIGGHYMNQDLMETIKETITEQFKSGRRPYKQIEEWINTTKFICATNNLPKLQLYEKAFLRRFKIINFPTDFTGREDRTLFDRIYEQEAGAVLSWILQNYSDWSILIVDWNDTEDFWRINSDIVRRFVNEECLEWVGTTTDAGKVYEAYVNYTICDQETPLSRKYFSQRMLKLGHINYQDPDGTWYYKGLSLKPMEVTA